MAWNWTLTTEDRQVFFGDDDALVVVDGWSVTPAKLRVDDRVNPRGDGLRFGQDYRAGQVIDFSMWVNGGDEATALDGLAAIQSAWRNDASRARGGSMCTLEHPRGRVAFGRPRGFSADAQRAEQGWATIKADFEAVDDLWYGPQQVTTIRFVPSVGAGLRFPARAPFRFGGAPTVRNGSVIVPGDVATWPVFEIRGPVVDPTIDIVGVGQLSFRVSLAYDERLVVDTRPWARWVKRGRTTGPDLSAAPGVLSSSGSRLSDVALSPGAYQVLLRGNDPTGTAELRASVWPAFTSF